MSKTVYYISPSTMPSRAANTMHVMFMCEALADSGYTVKLFIHSGSSSRSEDQNQIDQFYGIDSDRIIARVFRSRLSRGVELGIGVKAFFSFIKDRLVNVPPDYLIARNLFGAFFLGCMLRKNVVYETHAPELGIRKKIQSLIVNSQKVSTVVISHALAKVLASHLDVQESLFTVMHDAARQANKPMNLNEKVKSRQELLANSIDLSSFSHYAGYFGHLYAGRGIEIIISMARLNPDVAFIVYGGNDREVEKFQQENSLANIFFMGFLAPDLVGKAMAMMDVLLMPYQRSVSIGLKNIDTAQWMSPMKLFEYMSVQVPFISSDLPVLREVLIDEHNCLLVEPDNADQWSLALRKIIDDNAFAEHISANSYNEFISHYTWHKRAQGLLSLLPDSK